MKENKLRKKLKKQQLRKMGKKLRKRLAVKLRWQLEEKVRTKSRKMNREIPLCQLDLLVRFNGCLVAKMHLQGLQELGFSKCSFFFGSIAKEGSALGTNTGSLLGLTNNGSSFSSLLGTAPDASKSGKVSMQEVPIETGEENEKAVLAADAILYEYLDGGWKERGKGELKVNVSLSDSEKARLIMSARGNYRLILNASLYPDMSLTSIDKRGITFACVNSAAEGKTALTAFALKFKDSSMVEEFRGVVTAHKEMKDDSVLKTPENSPKASDN